MSQVRVLAEDGPQLVRMLGICEEHECHPTLGIYGRTFYRARSTDRWVLYKAALSGHGEQAPVHLHPEQR